jgi:hypothetical protein
MSHKKLTLDRIEGLWIISLASEVWVRPKNGNNLVAYFSGCSITVDCIWCCRAQLTKTIIIRFCQVLFYNFVKASAIFFFYTGVEWLLLLRVVERKYSLELELHLQLILNNIFTFFFNLNAYTHS